MDIIFKCPHCEQELSVADSGAGTEIECPTCSQAIVIPHPNHREVPRPMTMATNAPRPGEKPFVVPQHSKPADSLISKPLRPLDVAAKAGVINLTRSMAIELGSSGVLVNAIAPGSILTDGTRQLFYGEDGKFKAATQQLLDHIPLGRPGTTEEVAHAALFLAAPESSYINGHCLTVDGGWTAGYTRDF